jgi:hypothetical protein
VLKSATRQVLVLRQRPWQGSQVAARGCRAGSRGASAHDTAVHHVRLPGFKHMARYTLHYTKPSGARAYMREAA